MIISEKTIYEAIDKVNQLVENDPQGLMNSMAEEQPYIFGYVMAMGEEINDEDAINELVFFTVVVWQSFVLQYKGLQEVAGEIIEEIEEENLKIMDSLDSDEEVGQDLIADAVAKGLRQKELFGYLAGELLESNEADFGQEVTATLFTILKVIIESFDASIKKAA